MSEHRSEHFRACSTVWRLRREHFRACSTSGGFGASIFEHFRRLEASERGFSRFLEASSSGPPAKSPRRQSAGTATPATDGASLETKAATAALAVAGRAAPATEGVALSTRQCEAEGSAASLAVAGRAAPARAGQQPGLTGCGASGTAARPDRLNALISSRLDRCYYLLQYIL